jgi:excinuclease UvrABC nuclease subunit
LNARTCILYRWWDASGNLLYVGKSIRVLSRIEQHRQGSKFFDEATSMTLERFPDEVSLGIAEVEAIRAEKPIYNIVHNRDADAPIDLDPETFAALDKIVSELMSKILAGVLLTAGRAA